MNLSWRKLSPITAPILTFCAGLIIGLGVFGRSRYAPPPAIRDTQIHLWHTEEKQPQTFSNDDLSGDDEVQIYDVHDLLERPDKWLPLELSSDGTVRTAYADMDPSQRLAWLIRDYGGYPSWTLAGKKIVQINHFAGTLVITQTPANHARIAAFLEQLRKSTQ